MNPQDTIETTIRSLRCKLTNDQLMEQGRLLSEAGFNVRQLEEDKKRVTADYGAKIKTEKAKMPVIEARITTGCEFRDVECSIVWDKPKKGMKTLTRSDTGELIEEDLTPSEKQKRFDFEREVAEQEAEMLESKKKKKDEGLGNIDIPEEVKALKGKRGRK